MKTLKTLLFALAATAFFTSCSSDDDSNDNNGPDIEGTYNLVSVDIAEEVDFNQDGTASSNLMMESFCYEGSFITLNEDKTFTFAINFVDFTAQTGCNTEEGEGTWEASDSALTLTNTIMEVPNELIFAISDENTVTLTTTLSNSPYPDRDENGNPIYTTGSVQLTFNKVN